MISKIRHNTYKPKGKFYRLNFFIQAKEVRLIDEKGKQVGVVSKDEAIKKAKELGVDVVEIAPNAKPPVAKLIDFKKFKYLEAKKEQEEKKKQKNVGIKEVRLSPFIGQHDMEVRVAQATTFLKGGNQLKISLPFKGRQITRKEFGYDVMNRFLKILHDVRVVRPVHMEGKVMSATVVYDKNAKEVPTHVQT